MGPLEQALILKTVLDAGGLNALHSGLDATEEKSSRVGAALGVVGTALKVAVAGGAVAAVGGLVSSVTVAADFEQALHGVAAAAGVVGDDLDALRKSALQTGKDTALSATESVKAYGDLVKAGLSVKDVIGGAGRAVVDFAVSQGTSVEAMATLTSNSLNTFKSSLAAAGSISDQAKFIADTLAKTANASAIDVGQIAFSLQAVGPVADQAGLGITDFATAIGLMGNHALSGADAGTSLKTMLLALTAPTKTASDAMAFLGFTAFDAQGKVKPFRDILGELQAKTKNMSDEEKSGLYKQIFGTDAIRAANILIGEGTEGWDKLQATLKTAPGVADQAAERMKGLRGAIEQFKGSLETLEITVGEKFLPLLARVVTFGTNMINGLLDLDWSGVGKVFDAVAATISTKLSAAFEWLQPRLALVATWVQSTLLPLLAQFAAWVQGRLVPVLSAFLKTGIVPALLDMGRIIEHNILPFVGRLIDVLRTKAAPGILDQTQGVLKFLSDHHEILTTVGFAILAVAAAWQVYNVAAGIAAIVTGAVTSPFLLVTIGVAALAVGIVELVRHWDDIIAKFPIVGQVAGVAALALGGLIQVVTEDVVPFVLDRVKDVIGWLGDHQEVIAGAAIGIGTLLVTAFLGLAGAAATATASLILASLPIIGLVLGAALLGIGVVELIKHWDDLTKALPSAGDALRGVKDAAGEVKDWLVQHWQKGDFSDLLLAPFRAFRDAMGGVMTAAVNIMIDRLNDAAGPLNSFLSGISGAVNWISEHLPGNHEVKPNWSMPHIDHIGGHSGSDLPQGNAPVKAMAVGGLITEPVYGIGASGQRYLVGEQGPETVVPGNFQAVLDQIAQLGAAITSGKFGQLTPALTSMASNLATVVAAFRSGQGAGDTGLLRAGLSAIINQGTTAGISSPALDDIRQLIKELPTAEPPTIGKGAGTQGTVESTGGAAPVAGTLQTVLPFVTQFTSGPLQTSSVRYAQLVALWNALHDTGPIDFGGGAGFAAAQIYNLQHPGGQRGLAGLSPSLAAILSRLTPADLAYLLDVAAAGPAAAIGGAPAPGTTSGVQPSAPGQPGGFIASVRSNIDAGIHALARAAAGAIPDIAGAPILSPGLSGPGEVPFVTGPSTSAPGSAAAATGVAPSTPLYPGGPSGPVANPLPEPPNNIRAAADAYQRGIADGTIVPNPPPPIDPDQPPLLPGGPAAPVPAEPASPGSGPWIAGIQGRVGGTAAAAAAAAPGAAAAPTSHTIAGFAWPATWDKTQEGAWQQVAGWALAQEPDKAYQFARWLLALAVVESGTNPPDPMTGNLDPANHVWDWGMYQVNASPLAHKAEVDAWIAAGRDPHDPALAEQVQGGEWISAFGRAISQFGADALLGDLPPPAPGTTAAALDAFTWWWATGQHAVYESYPGVIGTRDQKANAAAGLGWATKYLGQLGITWDGSAPGAGAAPAAGPAPSAGWVVPVNAPYAILTEWGPNSNYTTGLHAGVDLVYADGSNFVGAPIKAAGAGKVTVAGATDPPWPLDKQGVPGIGYHIVVLDHGDIQTLYAHMNSMAVGLGQQVAAGQLVGTGDTEGNATGPHLHFETHRHTNPRHPYDYINHFGDDSFNPREIIPFARGGVITEPIVGRGTQTGNPYLFGEAGPEVVTPVNQSGMALEIANWAYGHQSGWGVLPAVFAQALATLSAYESKLSDVPEASGGGGVGPFQFTGDTLAAAIAAGFNIHRASGALDAFAASGDMRLGVNALLDGLAAGKTLELAAHDLELAMERPSAVEDARRFRQGDWHAAYILAQALVPSDVRGFAGGGLLGEPVAGWGGWSGRPYAFGERGPEWISPVAGGAGPSPVNNYITLQEGAITVSASDLDELGKVVTLFERLPQVARANGGRR